MKRTVASVALTACVVTGLVSAQTQAVKKSGAPVQPTHATATDKARAKRSTERTLRFITDSDSPPFSFKKGLERMGFEIDLTEAIGNEIGAKIKWIEMNFGVNAYASALDRKQADAAISSISITADRKDRLAFTRPYYRAGFAIAVQKDVDWEHQWFTSGLEGWKIGVMRGTTGERWARDNLAGKIETYANVDRLVQALKNSKGALKSGRAGFCILHDETILKWLLSDYSYRYQIPEKKIAREYYGIAVSKNNPKLLTEINAALENLRKNGTYKKIYKNWYKEAEDMPMFEK
ncbi:MAG: ABC transporter substrate-binding protein [bacterium]